ncbi:MAG: T9SS type A sorting domain-containing protein [bacterium]|nr:T9SS type A sorting domain-containing protein [bacterium]
MNRLALKKSPSAHHLKLNALPNPFKPATTISFTLAQPTRVKLEIFDIGSRVVSVPYIETLMPGPHSISFDGGGLPAGVYFARVSAGKSIEVKKLIHL